MGYNQQEYTLIDKLVSAMRNVSASSGASDYLSIMDQIDFDAAGIFVTKGGVTGIKGTADGSAGGITDYDSATHKLPIIVDSAGLDLKKTQDQIMFMQRFAHEFLRYAISHSSRKGYFPGDIADTYYGIPDDPHVPTRDEVRNAATYRLTKGFVDASLSELGATISVSNKVSDLLLDEATSWSVTVRRTTYAFEFARILKGYSVQDLTVVQLAALEKMGVLKFRKPKDANTPAEIAAAREVESNYFIKDRKLRERAEKVGMTVTPHLTPKLLTRSQYCHLTETRDNDDYA